MTEAIVVVFFLTGLHYIQMQQYWTALAYTGVLGEVNGERYLH